MLFKFNLLNFCEINVCNILDKSLTFACNKCRKEINPWNVCTFIECLLQIGKAVQDTMEATLKKHYGVNFHNLFNRQVTDAWDRAQEKVGLFRNLFNSLILDCNIIGVLFKQQRNPIFSFVICNMMI